MELNKNNLSFEFPKKPKKKIKMAYVILLGILLGGINLAGLLSYPRNDFVKQFYDPPLPANKYEQQNYQIYLIEQAETTKLALNYIQILHSQKTISIKETIRQVQKNATNKTILDLNIMENHLIIKPDLNYNRYYHENNKYIIDFKNSSVSIFNIRKENIEIFKKQLSHRNDLVVSENTVKDENGTDVPSLIIKIK